MESNSKSPSRIWRLGLTLIFSKKYTIEPVEPVRTNDNIVGSDKYLKLGKNKIKGGQNECKNLYFRRKRKKL